MVEVPEIDIGPLTGPAHGAGDVAAAVDAACRNVGFFAVVGHGLDPELQDRLDRLARKFFARTEAEKSEIAMTRGGRAWRGWFPTGGELTGGVPDDKEGLYFGADLGPDHPRVRAGAPLHGANLYPRHPEDLGPAVAAYMDAMTVVAQRVLTAVALGLGLPSSWFADHLTTDPLVLFRIFRYPARAPESRLTGYHRDAPGRWGVAEHTDYGLLTLLAQDGTGGLQVQTPDGWLDAPARPGTLLCNLGDMLERLTGGLYRSTPHRVRNLGRRDRLSFPFFLDPSWEAEVARLPVVDRPPDDDGAQRWDHQSVHGFVGTYGNYILSKVGKVFPTLATAVTADGHLSDHGETP